MPSPSTAYRHAGYRATGLWSDETVADLLVRRAAEHPDRELFVFEGRRVTYGEFEAWTAAVAADLVARGVAPGDRVLVQLPNRLEALVLQIAAFRAGAVDVPVIPIYREHEMRQILADCRPAALCSVTRLGERRPTEELDALAAEIGLEPTVRYAADEPAGAWLPVPGPGAGTPSLPPSRPVDEPCLLLYTSGTTSAPKGVLLTTQALVAHLRSFRVALGAGEHTTTLAATPLSHLGGFIAAVVFPVHLGGRSVVMAGWKPDEAVELITTERVTLMMGATVFLSDLVDRYARGAGDGYRLDVYACAGASIPPAVIDRAAEVGVRAVRAYGMTETAGVCAIASGDDPLHRRREWDGRLIPGMEIEVVDEAREVLAPGEVGELRLRTPQLLERYTDPQVTAMQFDAEGWFYPGDVGRVDAEGWVQVLGRTKDIVNRGGEKFSTGDIEAALASHPAVQRAAVTAVRDDRLGEAVGAWVVLADAASWSEAKPLVEHLEELRLARPKIPVEWHVVPEIPTTAIGKVQKHRLAELDDLHTWDTRESR
ncbi:class I adenylate-forming enzyme family protein [Actinomycetospora aeridis]|uniref:AMP-binding protein n=1 Tax=Actinomycetospora aeridis TaxID=3129231 RepID=A0ABU8N101_9PSEU